MSDPIATSILSKLTSWYPLDADLNDAHGSNHLATGVTNAGFSAGKLGNKLDAGSKAGVTIASPIAVTPTSGSFTVGGWLYYQGSVPLHADFGLSRDYGAVNEVFTVYSVTGAISAFGWLSGGDSAYSVGGLSPTGLSYPITVQAQDSIGQTATSDQIITIVDPATPLATGWYFAVMTWENGNRVAYVDSKVTDTQPPPASLNATSITRFQIGNQYNDHLSVAGLDSIFFCDGDALTHAEVTWLYNLGAGRSYADIQAAA